jgi:hypothetical protein
VVSTAIHDVVRTYGGTELVFIANTSQEFIRSIELALGAMENPSFVCAQADTLLRGMSWEHTWEDMYALIEERLHTGQASHYLPQMTTKRQLPARR